MQTFKTIRLQVQAEDNQNILHIVGRNQFLNELLANFLLQEQSLYCQRVEDAAAPQMTFGDQAPQCLHLIDAHNLTPGECWSEVSDCRKPDGGCYHALFNVDLASGIEAEAMRNGARGLFYTNESLEMVCKGIQKIMGGDVWFSRETLLNCILQQPEPSKSGKGITTDDGINLTFREEEILQYLRQGATNQEIADEMVVSVYTVKTHLYNLYKKINVPNRFQAMLWAASNLP